MNTALPPTFVCTPERWQTSYTLWTWILQKVGSYSTKICKAGTLSQFLLFPCISHDTGIFAKETKLHFSQESWVCKPNWQVLSTSIHVPLSTWLLQMYRVCRAVLHWSLLFLNKITMEKQTNASGTHFFLQTKASKQTSKRTKYRIENTWKSLQVTVFYLKWMKTVLVPVACLYCSSFSSLPLENIRVTLDQQACETLSCSKQTAAQCQIWIFEAIHH